MSKAPAVGTTSGVSFPRSHSASDDIHVREKSVCWKVFIPRKKTGAPSCFIIARVCRSDFGWGIPGNCFLWLRKDNTVACVPFERLQASQRRMPEGENIHRAVVEDPFVVGIGNNTFTAHWFTRERLLRSHVEGLLGVNWRSPSSTFQLRWTRQLNSAILGNPPPAFSFQFEILAPALPVPTSKAPAALWREPLIWRRCEREDGSLLQPFIPVKWGF